MEALEPTRDDINRLSGVSLLEFGASWCGYCKAAQLTITQVLSQCPEVRHIKIEDGKGRRLGRSFHVKRWPTLVLIKNGTEVGRFERDIEALTLRDALLCLRE